MTKTARVANDRDGGSNGAMQLNELNAAAKAAGGGGVDKGSDALGANLRPGYAALRLCGLRFDTAGSGTETGCGRLRYALVMCAMLCHALSVVFHGAVWRTIGLGNVDSVDTNLLASQILQWLKEIFLVYALVKLQRNGRLESFCRTFTKTCPIIYRFSRLDFLLMYGFIFAIVVLAILQVIWLIIDQAIHCKEHFNKAPLNQSMTFEVTLYAFHFLSLVPQCWFAIVQYAWFAMFGPILYTVYKTAVKINRLMGAVLSEPSEDKDKVSSLVDAHYSTFAHVYRLNQMIKSQIFCIIIAMVVTVVLYLHLITTAVEPFEWDQRLMFTAAFVELLPDALFGVILAGLIEYTLVKMKWVLFSALGKSWMTMSDLAKKIENYGKLVSIGRMSITCGNVQPVTLATILYVITLTTTYFFMIKRVSGYFVVTGSQGAMTAMSSGGGGGGATGSAASGMGGGASQDYG